MGLTRQLTIDLLTFDKGDSHVLAAKQPGLKSGGLQSVVSDAGEGWIRVVEELCSHILIAWDELDQRIVDNNGIIYPDIYATFYQICLFVQRLIQ